MMSSNRFRVVNGIPKEARKAHIKKTDAWCEYPLRFGGGDTDIECIEYRHYVRCTEHEYCHCTGDTLILICDRCWNSLLNEIRGKKLAERAFPPLREVSRKAPER